MPELPEVETVCRGLRPYLEGIRIRRVETRRRGLRVPFPVDLSQRLVGRTVAHVDRRSKYALIRTEGGPDAAVMILHLGMSGRVRVDLPGAWPDLLKHDHLVLEMETGARVVLNDARRFGMVMLANEADLPLHPLLRDLGPEPLGEHFDAPYLLNRLKGRKSPLKTALMNQQLVAGLGNIYVCESLFRARLSPRRLASSLTPDRAGRLVEAVQTVLKDAIAAGGSTLQDHAQVSGELGYFQHRFRVYGREGEPCLTPGCESAVQKLVQAGRSTFFCGHCQR
ncbi:formamidopyrimidine-DNA glycosylase [Iodidimonas muriae]|uniref:Formamidopyrimidine-DNA glycosylase n=1 Tax=Iodidimonas muriae TaxID=261467 RepID=A0ABQ2L887_9PROT|nr:bifunctional DNA-formamidopyrimidine glycosylase/DNA-(apurinic or apyrimidinic site) lyase [Iodidimonas muriae]GER05728.1 formamidopyrimidine-DNA glycosylase [Kordiimonadales bacterium JCM 17843]GGO06677.1 formamidopyrimidine-DNA glycosylase [Iodidimonas muriae]